TSTLIHNLSLHDALPNSDAMQWQVVSLDAEEGGYRVKTLMKDIPTSIYEGFLEVKSEQDPRYAKTRRSHSVKYDGKKPLEFVLRSEEHTSELQSREKLVC